MYRKNIFPEKKSTAAFLPFLLQVELINSSQNNGFQQKDLTTTAQKNFDVKTHPIILF